MKSKSLTFTFNPLNRSRVRSKFVDSDDALNPLLIRDASLQLDLLQALDPLHHWHLTDFVDLGLPRFSDGFGVLIGACLRTGRHGA